jgi:hypothetical protein
MSGSIIPSWTISHSVQPLLAESYFGTFQTIFRVFVQNQLSLVPFVSRKIQPLAFSAFLLKKEKCCPYAGRFSSTLAGFFLPFDGINDPHKKGIYLNIKLTPDQIKEAWKTNGENLDESDPDQAELKNYIQSQIRRARRVAVERLARNHQPSK